MTQALNEIDDWIDHSQSWHALHIRQNAAPVYGAHPGLERAIIDLYAEECRFCFSEEVYELYQWHDGNILMGEMANPISLSSLDHAMSLMIQGHVPYRPYLPLFVGDDAYYVIPQAVAGQATSPIFFFDGRIMPGDTKPIWGNFCPSFFAPSITALMQAMAECIKTYDGISAEYMRMDDANKELDIYLDHTYNLSILTPIYQKYGVVGTAAGLWR
ncbi:hypothetical protein IQ266_12320 [filamentous cyanobacterium LEGE 11480]|uniref:Knr4/Smi1-like domain-containing protein n=1 Tax=Romeriopsis navalis LEGE 11480 TaxID=2777977 RepID=A0A928VL15_9CYAN|nr:hypothetical protein [Romeriopsis navalis]MBE9030516.1 hypothetical protein [Romeriopsis navalis LEGE 11480]